MRTGWEGRSCLSRQKGRRLQGNLIVPYNYVKRYSDGGAKPFSVVADKMQRTEIIAWGIPSGQ